MRRTPVIFIFLFALATWAGPPRSMKVFLDFESQKTNLQVKVFKLPVERAIDAPETNVTALSQPMENLPSLGQGFTMKKGSIQAFLMVVENPTNTPRYFFAVSHTISPPSASVGFRLGCLCNHHIFEVPPRSRWSRVGNVTLESSAQGDTIKFIHKIFEVSQAEIKEKGLESNVNSATHE